MTEISAKKRDSETAVTVNYDMPETLDALVEKFGAEIVYGAAVDSFTISIQSIIRRHIEDPAAAQAAVDAWVPGQRTAGVKKTPQEKALAALKSMSAEDRAALLASFQ